MFDVIAETMSNSDDDKLDESIHEFDRLMAAEHDAFQSTEETQVFLTNDDIKLAMNGSKLDVDGDDAEHSGIELVQLPVPHDQEKSKQLTASLRYGSSESH